MIQEQAHILAEVSTQWHQNSATGGAELRTMNRPVAKLQLASKISQQDT